MERRGVKQSIVVACLVVALLLMGSHRSEAVNFPTCYKSCFILCIITPGESILKCGFKCLKDCIIHPPSLSSSLAQADADSFCKLRCSMSRCTHLSTKTDARETEVSGCVDSCSGMCSKQQH